MREVHTQDRVLAVPSESDETSPQRIQRIVGNRPQCQWQMIGDKIDVCRSIAGPVFELFPITCQFN